MKQLITDEVNDQVRLGDGESGCRRCVGRESLLLLPSTAPATAAAHREAEGSSLGREKLPLRSLRSTELGWLRQICLFSSDPLALLLNHLF